MALKQAERKAAKSAGARGGAGSKLFERAVERSTMFRAGSIARFKWQTDFYYRLVLV